jgi:enoyl-CoA hydratase
MAYSTILYDVNDPVATITLNRPAVLNAQNQQMKEELDDAFVTAARDNQVHVIVLRGAGRAFSAGHDLKRFPKDPSAFSGPSDDKWFEGDSAGVRDLFYEAITLTCLRIRAIKKPTIAQIHGYCVAGGWLLASMCDLVICSEDARFRNPVVLMAAGGLELLIEPWDVGVRKAKELMWTGDYLEAREAQRLGLVNRVVPRANLEEETMRLAQRIAKMPPATARGVKRSINHMLDLKGWRLSQEHHFEIWSSCMVSDEHHAGHEGMSAGNLKEFIQRRDQPYKAIS